MASGSLLILGTSSGTGKSTIVTGLCRWLSRQGVSVAPFKAQNMSLNSYVTREGGEIGRAQVIQAQAAGVEPDVLMNPVLLKPGTDSTSQLIVLGHPVGDLDAATGWHEKRDLLDVVVEAHAELRRRFDVVMCEGAGSPAEINLRRSDIANLGFARAAGVAGVLVGDIDRGGMFASLIGTLAVLEPEDQHLVRGFIVNKFRGSKELLQTGIDQLSDLTGRPTYGVLPFRRGLELDAEDAIDFTSWLDASAPCGEDVLSVGVIAFPRASNLTDFDPLIDEPGVVLRPLYRPEEMRDCDLVVIPGTRATVNDLAWLRERGFDDALVARVAERRSVLGLCGGYQMLGIRIDDEVESARGTVEGLGLLPTHTIFQRDKVLAQVEATLGDGSVVRGYEIHHGRVFVDGESFFGGDGCARGPVAGTLWHGLFENDGWRRAYLTEVALLANKRFIADTDHSFAARREARLETLADLIDEHLDTAALLSLLTESNSPLPTVRLTRE